MHFVAGLVGLLMLIAAICDAFQTVVVARHAVALPAMTRLFYTFAWIPLAASSQLFSSDRRRAGDLGFYGPLSLLLLLTLWAIGIIAGFALLQWSVGHQSGGNHSSLSDELYSHLLYTWLRRAA